MDYGVGFLHEKCKQGTYSRSRQPLSQFEGAQAGPLEPNGSLRDCAAFRRSGYGRTSMPVSPDPQINQLVRSRASCPCGWDGSSQQPMIARRRRNGGRVGYGKADSTVCAWSPTQSLIGASDIAGTTNNRTPPTPSSSVRLTWNAPGPFGPDMSTMT